MERQVMTRSELVRLRELLADFALHCSPTRNEFRSTEILSDGCERRIRAAKAAARKDDDA
jgi:hypothetical protein